MQGCTTDKCSPRHFEPGELKIRNAAPSSYSFSQYDLDAAFLCVSDLISLEKSMCNLKLIQNKYGIFQALYKGFKQIK